MTLDNTNIVNVMHLNSVGVSSLVSGNIQGAKSSFEQALRTSLMEAEQLSGTRAVPIGISLTSVPMASHRMRGISNAQNSLSSSHLQQIVTYETASFSSYKQAFLVFHETETSTHPPATNQEDIASSFSAVVMFNMALTFHHQHMDADKQHLSQVEGATSWMRRQQQQHQRQERSSKGKAIRLYDATLDLLFQAPSEANDWWWNLLIVTLFNKACVLCDLSQYERAQHVVLDLTEIMLRTAYRPPFFQDDHVQELRLRSLLSGSPAKHAAAA